MKKVVLQGILFDEKSSYLKGPSLAPPLIRKAYHNDSSNYCAEDGSHIHPDIIEDKGNHQVKKYFDISELTTKHLEKRKPLLTLGGDHSITFPIIQAFHSIYGPVDILHIDAHSDLYDQLDGDPYSHACPFYNIMKNKLAANLFQVGIRTLNKLQRDNAQAFGVQISEMRHFDSFQMPVFQNPLYLSLDIDVLDPAFAPGVSHHEPGGLSTRQVLQLIQNINVPIVGADIVEYNPKQDLNGMTAMVCSKFMKEIISKMTG